MIPDMCKGCKLLGIKCEGQDMLQGMTLLKCKGYIKSSSNAVISDDAYIPFKIKGVKNGKRKG